MSQNQPGSTVKPLVGLSAITEGVATSTEGIECTGFLVIDGKRQRTGAAGWRASGENGSENKAWSPPTIRSQVSHRTQPAFSRLPTRWNAVATSILRTWPIVLEWMRLRVVLSMGDRPPDRNWHRRSNGTHPRLRLMSTRRATAQDMVQRHRAGPGRRHPDPDG